MNTMKTMKTTADLSWMAMKYRFHSIELLKAAIADGTIDSMIKACADSMYEGDIAPVVKALRRNLSSKATNAKKAKVVAPENRDDKKRLEMLWDYTGKLAEANKPARCPGVASSKGKAAWQWSLDEIDAIAPDDIKTLKHVYDGMMSKKSKQPEAIEETVTMAVFLDKLDKVSSKYAAAKKLQEKQKNISATLLEKLNKGTKVSLSAEELEEIRSLLK